jgi:glutaredoxin-related protein
MLDDMLVEYESVDTLDEIHNHNLRNVLKQFGNWPQVYHNGEFLGGHDILDELQKSGKLAAIFQIDESTGRR